MYAQDLLFLFVRYPEAGTVKTRLIPELGRQRAAQLYQAITEQVLEQTRRFAYPGLQRIVVVEPANRVADVEKWLGEGPLYRAPPPVAGLGPVLQAIFADAFAKGGKRVAAIGTDCLDLSAQHLRDAFGALHRVDAVVGPALDGGYTFIGLSKEYPALFDGIGWGTGRVLEQTKKKLRDARMRTEFLPPLRDLDRFEDLEALAPAWPDLLDEFLVRS